VKPFQLIVNTYGIPSYKEANPGLVTLVTFPFLFGVMYGDVGHGLMVFLFALSLFAFPKCFPSSILENRGMLVMMGFFAIYCGLIYNDFLAVGFPITDSCYDFVKGATPEEDQFVRQEGCNYPLGMDYSWHQSANAIGFINSFKMKTSIVFGVIHMLVGISMKGINSIYFRDFLGFFFEFLPQFIFMSVTFGYMVICIIMKWLTNYEDPATAPSIITLFINFV